MSIRFSGGAAVHADFGTAGLTSAYPVTITVWLFIPTTSQPGSGKVWPVWSFGVPGDNHYLCLEVEPGMNAGTIKLVAAFRGTTRTQTSLDNVARGDWHCVSVTLVDQTAVARIKLYVDSDTATPVNGSKAGLDPTAWSQFLLARTLRQDAGDIEDPSFDAEQVAIWEKAIGDPGGGADNENKKMFNGKIPPKDVKDSVFPSLAGPPDFSYWFLTAHSRSGLRVLDNQTSENGGDLFNEAEAAVERPSLRRNQGTPRWSSNTPVLRYSSDQAFAPSRRRVVREPSRLQPMFFVLNLPPDSSETPTAQGVTAAQLRQQAPYTDPNIWKICDADYLSSNGLPPPFLGDREDYVPVRELSLVAKRCADHFETQNLYAGTGTGPGGQYAGCVQIRGPGHGGLVGDIRRGTLKLRGFDGELFRNIPGDPNGIPLEFNIGDWLYAGPTDLTERPWSCWYRATGTALLSEFMNLFWEALKQELDDRGLCYPLRLHMDYEDWPRETEQLSFVGEASQGEEVDAQVGTWPAIVSDPRAFTEHLVFEYGNSGAPVARTLDDLSPPTYVGTEDFYDQSQTFIDWWWRYSFLTRTQACADAVIADMNTFFPYTTWGNYYNFTADNTDYPFAVNDERLYVTAPYGVFPAQYSTPVLFTNPEWVARARGSQGGRVGYTMPESVRDVAKTRIDACANSRQRFPMVPTYENADRAIFLWVCRTRGVVSI